MRKRKQPTYTTHGAISSLCGSEFHWFTRQEQRQVADGPSGRGLFAKFGASNWRTVLIWQTFGQWSLRGSNTGRHHLYARGTLVKDVIFMVDGPVSDVLAPTTVLLLQALRQSFCTQRAGVSGDCCPETLSPGADDYRAPCPSPIGWSLTEESHKMMPPRARAATLQGTPEGCRPAWQSSGGLLANPLSPA